MDAIIIKSKKRGDLKLIKELVNKIGLEATSLSKEDVEDIGLNLLMKEADRSKTVSREYVISKLKNI